MSDERVGKKTKKPMMKDEPKTKNKKVDLGSHLPGTRPESWISPKRKGRIGDHQPYTATTNHFGSKKGFQRGWCMNCQNLREQQHVYHHQDYTGDVHHGVCGGGARIVGFEKEQVVFECGGRRDPNLHRCILGVALEPETILGLSGPRPKRPLAPSLIDFRGSPEIRASYQANGIPKIDIEVTTVTHSFKACLAMFAFGGTVAMHVWYLQ